jgi:hypothetical protein
MPTISISGAETHRHAARRLRESLPGASFVEAGGDVAIALRLDPALAEGEYRIAASGAAIEIAGGPFSGVIYGAEEAIARSATGLDPAAFATPVTGKPGLAYRTFWTWDHSTNWELSQIGQQEIGVFNPFQKPPSGFLADYRRLVDFCSRNRIAAIVIYGFLRDTHGGIEAAQELCRYANERGVRIMPRHRHRRLWRRLLGGQAPLQPRRPGSTPTRSTPRRWKRTSASSSPTSPSRSTSRIPTITVTACPSAPETMDWMEEAVSWLAETFEIGGINIESGDYGVCGCEKCVARRRNDAEAARRKDAHGDSWSHTDMADQLPAPLSGGQGEAPRPLDLLRDAVGQPARSGRRRGADRTCRAAASTSTPPTRASGSACGPS